MEEKILQIAPSEYQDCIDRKDAAKMRVLAGDSLVALKVREKTNKNDGFLVELIQKTAGGGKGQAWCEWTGQTLTAFVEEKLGIKSRSPVSGSCAHMRKHTPKDMIFPLDEALPGDQLYLIRANGLGHSAEVRRRLSKKVIETNEGNTTQGKAGGEIIREGGGMYRCERLQSMWKVCTRPFPPVGTAPVVGTKPAAEADGIPKYGERSDRVATLQKALNAKGAKIEIDTQFGPKTKAAVGKFQKENGLPGSGVLGKKTMALLGI